MDFLTQKFSDLGVKKSTVHNFLKTDFNLSFKKLKTQPAARNSPTKIQDRKDWVIKWSATDMNYLKNRVFVDESGFSINMRPPSGWALKGKPAVAETPAGRAVSHAVLGAITTKFVVSMELQNPQESSKRIKIDFSNRKGKSPAQKKKPTSKGTATGHYMKFLEKAMNELGCFPELKGYYIVMDNALIHTADQVDEMIVVREYKSIYLPPYSPELNPIEQFWSIVKNKVKQSSFEANEDLTTRIAEACNCVPPKHLQAFA